MISAFQWPVSLEAKWRALYGSLLLGLLPVCGSPCIWGGWISFKGVVITWFGLCLGIVHVPGSSAGRRGSWRCTVVLCGLIAFLTTCLAGFPCATWAYRSSHLFDDQGGGTPTVVPEQQETPTFVVLSLIWACCMLREHPRSTCTHDAKWCMFAFWLGTAATQVGEICFAFELVQAPAGSKSFGDGVQCVALGWTLYLLQMRIKGIQSRMSQTSRLTSGSHLWILVMCGSWPVRHMYSFAHFWLRFWLVVVSVSVLCIVWVAHTALICRSLLLDLSLLLQEAGRVRGPPRKHAIWAAKVVGVEILICAILGMAICCHGIASGLAMWKQKQWPLAIAPSDEDVRTTMQWMDFALGAANATWVVNSLGLGVLSGILWQVQPPSDDPQPGCGLTRGLVSMSSLLSPSERDVYDQVVKQLANRGFRLVELLSFWERLFDGRMMPGFDPGRSLTNDVVRRAIIPESRVGGVGCALSSLWSSTETKPQVMVTHNWSNGFGSLVAAILADALGQAAFQDVAAQIATASGREQVRAKLGRKLETTYWVCAFCINQHASICAGFGPEPPQGTPEWTAWDRRRYDSVTGDKFVPCNCQVEKVLSHTDARCELNKFDDMMTHLALEVAGFTQLIVVDDAFDVLYRAWCVAEIFEASVLGMTSRIRIRSQAAVDQNYDRLAMLDVRQCTASSQADKDMIMAKISDVKVFNWRIQQLVFGEDMGLFAQWVDGNERSRQVGRIVRRCAMQADSSNRRPACTSCGCCTSMRLLWSLDGDSDESSGESPASETSDSWSSSS